MGGAFELCLPSLGFLFTKLTLRFAVLGLLDRMANVGHRAQDRADADLEQYVLLTVLVIKPVQPVHSDARCGYDYDVESYVVPGFHLRVRYLLRMYCATPNRPSIAIQNR